MNANARRLNCVSLRKRNVEISTINGPRRPRRDGSVNHMNVIPVSQRMNADANAERSPVKSAGRGSVINKRSRRNVLRETRRWNNIKVKRLTSLTAQIRMSGFMLMTRIASSPVTVPNCANIDFLLVAD